jgi:hypothetical protein
MQKWRAVSKSIASSPTTSPISNTSRRIYRYRRLDPARIIPQPQPSDTQSAGIIRWASVKFRVGNIEMAGAFCMVLNREPRERR